uniref:KHA domain-containing protein n=1 Tax=Saimiri boliviensis boliviensis TaxID=39432 RepID=A0A2K6SNM9_SAIBB
MRRVTLFLNGSPKNGQVVAIYGTLSDLLSVASSKLSIEATSVYNGKGGLIDGVVSIRDDGVLSDRQLSGTVEKVQNTLEGLVQGKGGM